MCWCILSPSLPKRKKVRQTSSQLKVMLTAFFDFLSILYQTIAPPSTGSVNNPCYWGVLRQLHYKISRNNRTFAINGSSTMITSVPIYLRQPLNLWMMSFLKLWSIRRTALTWLLRIYYLRFWKKCSRRYNTRQKIMTAVQIALKEIPSDEFEKTIFTEVWMSIMYKLKIHTFHDFFHSGE